MTDRTLERRHLLRGAGIAAGGAAVATGIGIGALVTPAAADDDHDDDHDHDDHGKGRRLSGSWLINVHNDDGSETLSVLSLAAGSVAIVHDINPAGPPFTGTWKGRGDRFRATVWSGFPGNTGPGSAGGTIKIRLRGEVERRRMEGTFTFVTFDPEGVETFRGTGTFDGRPIEA